MAEELEYPSNISAAPSYNSSCIMSLRVTSSAERLDGAEEKTRKKNRTLKYVFVVLSGDILFENKGIVRLLTACVYFDSFCQRECRSPRLGVLWNDTC